MGLSDKRGYTFFVLAIGLVLLFVTVSWAGAAACTDEVGRKVDIPENPLRIVSLAPSITETLFSLGLDAKIVGVTLYSNYPAKARSKVKIGSYISVQLEKVAALEPDLIIGTSNGNKRETLDQLMRLGYAVYITNPRNIQEVLETVLNIGKITGRKDRAVELVRSLRRRIDRVLSKTSARERPRVFFQIGDSPIVSVGRETFHHMLINMAGGENISAKAPMQYPRYSIEEVVLERPDVIIVSSMKRGGDFERIKEKWRRWKDVPAVKNRNIRVIDSDLTDHPSPRIIDGLERLAAIIHPEAGW